VTIAFRVRIVRENTEDRRSSRLRSNSPATRALRLVSVFCVDERWPNLIFTATHWTMYVSQHAVTSAPPSDPV